MEEQLIGGPSVFVALAEEGLGRGGKFVDRTNDGHLGYFCQRGLPIVFGPESGAFFRQGRGPSHIVVNDGFYPVHAVDLALGRAAVFLRGEGRR